MAGQRNTQSQPPNFRSCRQDSPNIDGSATNLLRNCPKCLRSSGDVHLMAKYKTHTAETLGYTDQNMRDCQQYWDVFLEFTAYKWQRSPLRTERKQYFIPLRRFPQSRDRNVKRFGKASWAISEVYKRLRKSGKVRISTLLRCTYCHISGNVWSNLGKYCKEPFKGSQFVGQGTR